MGDLLERGGSRGTGLSTLRLGTHESDELLPVATLRVHVAELLERKRVLRIDFEHPFVGAHRLGMVYEFLRVQFRSLEKIVAFFARISHRLGERNERLDVLVVTFRVTLLVELGAQPRDLVGVFLEGLCRSIRLDLRDGFGALCRRLGFRLRLWLVVALGSFGLRFWLGFWVVCRRRDLGAVGSVEVGISGRRRRDRLLETRDRRMARGGLSESLEVALGAVEIFFFAQGDVAGANENVLGFLARMS